MTEKTETKTAEQLAEELAEARAEIDRVNAKKAELLAEKATWKSKTQEAKDAQDAAALEAAEKAGDIEALKAAHKKELDKYIADMKTAHDLVKTYKIDAVIKDALTANNVKPEYAKAVTAMIRGEATWDDKTLEARVGDVDLGAYANTFLKSKDGEHFIQAPQNNGGNSSTNNGSRAHNIDPAKPNYTELAKMALQDPAAYNAAVDSIGKPNLKTNG